MMRCASKKMIADRLRQLETQVLIERRVIDASPIALEYVVTPFDKTALGRLDQLRI